MTPGQNAPPPKTYEPEKISYRRLSLNTLLLMLVYHGVSFLFYDLFGSESMVNGPPDMDAFLSSFVRAFIWLCIMGVIFAGIYFKNAARRRAFLDATSIELRGVIGIREGVSRYRKLALTESLVCALTAGALWVIPSVLYLISLFLWGYGFLYGQALAIEKIFIGFIGLCEPFQNSLVGMLIGMGILFCFHYFGRLYAHHYWQEHRIRR